MLSANQTLSHSGPSRLLDSTTVLPCFLDPTSDSSFLTLTYVIAAQGFAIRMSG